MTPVASSQAQIGARASGTGSQTSGGVLEGQEKGAGGEIQLTDAMAQLIGNQPFHGFTFDGQRYDCGDKAGYVQANLAIALARGDIGPAVRDFAKELLC